LYHSKPFFAQGAIIWGTEKPAGDSKQISGGDKIQTVIEGESPTVKVACYDAARTPKSILGLYSDGFSVCNIMVLISSNKQLMVLVHVDEHYPDDILMSDIEYVDKDCQKYIFRRCHSEAELITRKIEQATAGAKFVVEVVADEVIGISVDRKGKITKHTTQATNLLLHPQEYRIKLVDKVHEILAYGAPLVKSPMIYTALRWEEKELHQDHLRLCKHTKNILKTLEISSNTPYSEIYQKLMNFFNQNLQYFNVAKSNPNFLVQISLRVKLTAQYIPVANHF
jgi:hypothetical protein